MMSDNTNIAKPFIKWVGGKSQLLPQFETILPSLLYTEDFTYIEPFVGGGAMLFYMLQHFPNMKNVVINDINRNLTNAYQTIKDEPEQLVDKLKSIEKEYLNIVDNENRREYFLSIRKRFNEEQINMVEKTALFIFLNRTCFNGLYRENSKGLFNVPFGRYVNPSICNESIIYSDSELLNKFNVNILCGDFKQIEKHIDDKDLNFIYFDPPYRPLSSTSSFNSYVKESFNDDRQKDLAAFCRHLSRKTNILWMLSNSDCSSKNPEDTFFENIYEGFNIHRVYASRMVNSNPNKRGKLTELLITNFDSYSCIYTSSAEELIQMSKNKENFLFEFGDSESDVFDTNKYRKDIAKTKNYSQEVFYHADGGYGECGIGRGLYLGKDIMALFNFYNGEGEFGEKVIEYRGNPRFLDLVSWDDLQNFKEEAVKLYGKQNYNDHLKSLTLAKGFDGIRYFDLYTTGEEFVLYNTEKVKKTKEFMNEELSLRVI